MQAIRDVQTLDADGRFVERAYVSWASGRFDFGAEHGEFDGPAISAVQNGAGLWLIPGLVDAHAHVAWHAFEAIDRLQLTPAEQRTLTSAALARNLAAGVTSLRDAGGLTTEAWSEVSEHRPRVQRSERALGRAEADAQGGLDRAVDQVLSTGAEWVKLVATASVTSPAGAALEPVFTAAEVRDAVRRADAAGARVMMHAWGGSAIDDAINAGATSIEHGIFLTDDQARRAAARDMTLVPTLHIYRQVAEMIRQGSLPAAFRGRIDEAIAAHPHAVLRARDAGLALAVGTDSGTPEQHGSAVAEIDALIAAGLTPEEALIAATRGGAALLARGTAAEASLAGTIAPGAVADAVVLGRDPREPGALRDPEAIVAVIVGGREVDLAAARQAGSLANHPECASSVTSVSLTPAPVRALPHRKDQR